MAEITYYTEEGLAQLKAELDHLIKVERPRISKEIGIAREKGDLKETHHWINKEFVKNCAKQPILINTSRGAIANTVDLFWALQKDKIRGLCLDVFEDEPLNSQKVNPLALYQEILTYDNVIVTPHIAGWTDEAKQKLVSILVKKIEEKVIKQGKR